MNIHFTFAISSIIFLLLSSTIICKGQATVRVIENKTQIYDTTSTNANHYLRVQSGDTFDVKKVHGNWVKVNLFSGSSWFIKHSKVEIANKIPPYPSDPATRNNICVKVKKAQKKASQKAMSDYAHQVSKQATYENVLFDKYVSKIFRNYQVSFSHNSMLIECNDDSIIRWFKKDG